jgi:hypothetical protein
MWARDASGTCRHPKGFSTTNATKTTPARPAEVRRR